MTQRHVLSGMAGRTPKRARMPRVALSLTLLGLALGGCADPASESAGRPEQAALSSADKETPSTSPSAGGEVDIDPMPSGGQTPVAGQPWDADATAACAGVVPEGLSEVAQSADDGGVTSFWSGADGWVACDVAGEEPVIIEAPAGAATGFDEGSLAISSTATDDGARHTAAGLLPWPVQELAYTFPDSHTEQARFVSTEGAADQVWWVVSYTATDGPLADADADTAGLDPVTVSVVGAAAEAFRFGWDELQRSE